MKIFSMPKTIIGKAALIACILLIGFVAGYKAGVKNAPPAQQTNIEIKDIKAKKGSTIEIDTKTNQDQDNKTDKSKKKGFFHKIFN